MGVLLTYVEPTVAASVNGTSHKYVCDDNGIWMPFFNESQIPLPLRATLYLLGLIYIFVGIALASDMLMCSIGCITRQTITKKTISGEVKVIPMWNATVANLTLLALGTSAPEILLSIIEVTSRGMKAGYLGPGSVVGSAAFNLLFITAVCIASVGSNETRRVNQIKVYAITLVYSMIGYAWLIMILRVTSPNIIDVWEAFGTLLLFFGLIISAYYCDKHSKDSEYTPRLWMTNLRGESLSMNSSLESSANLVKCVSGTLTPQMSVAEPRGSEVESPVQDSAMISGWREQISTAFHTSPGPCLAGRYFCHAVMFVWKICFSLVPPPSLWGGYPTFIISLAVIGILITLVSDMASLFGCLTGLKDLVVAFSFLAVGTSLPELFTSRLAAIRFKHADHSLGNVIGSNCINVFVGLGLPWFIASIYWRVRGQQFDIDGKSLSFTIGIYTCTAVAYTLMMIMRRNLKVCGKAEFGGPTVCKYLSAAFLVALWVAYISLSSLNVSGLLPFY